MSVSWTRYSTWCTALLIGLASSSAWAQERATDGDAELPEFATLRLEGAPPLPADAPPADPAPAGWEGPWPDRRLLVREMVVSVDGGRAVARSHGELRLFDLDAGNLLSTIPFPEHRPASLAFDAAGTTLFALTEFSGDVRSWTVATGEEQPSQELLTKNYLTAALSPDARHVVGASFDGSLEVWDRARGERTGVAELRLARSIQFARGGTRFSVGTSSADLVFSTASVTEVARVVEPRGRLAMDASGRVVVTIGRQLAARDIDAGERFFEHEFDGMAAAAITHAVSADGNLIATGHRNALRVWDTRSGRMLAVLGKGRGLVTKVAFLRDSSTLAAAGIGGAIHLWDVESAVAAAPAGEQPNATPPRLDLNGDPLPDGAVARLGSTRFRGPGWSRAVQFGPDGSWIVAGDKRGLMLWDVASGQVRRQLMRSSSEIYSVAESPDGAQVAWVQAFNGPAGVVAWKAEDGELLSEDRSEQYGGTLAGNEAASLQFVPGNGLIACPGPRASIALRRPADGEIVRRVVGTDDEGPFFGSVFTFSADGTRVVAPLRYTDEGLRAFTVKGLEPVATFGESGFHAGTVTHVRFSPDGKYLVTAGLLPQGGSSVARVRVFDATSTELLSERLQPGASVWGLAVSPDSQRVAWAGDGSTLEVASLPDLEPVVPVSGHSGPITAILPTGAGSVVMTTSEDGTVREWDLATGAELSRVANIGRPVEGLAIAPDGSHIAFVGEECHLLVLRVADSEWVLHRPAEFPHEPFSVAFLGDGERICVGTLNGQIELVNLESSEVEILRVSDIGGYLPVRLGRLADGRVVAADTKGLAVIDAKSGALTAGYLEQTEAQIAFAVARDGGLLAAAQRSGPLRVWDVAEDEPRFEIAPIEGWMGSTNNWEFPAVSPDGRLVAATVVTTVFLWDGTSGEEIARFPAAEDGGRKLTALSFSADGKLLVVARDDATALVFPIP